MLPLIIYSGCLGSRYGGSRSRHADDRLIRDAVARRHVRSVHGRRFRLYWLNRHVCRTNRYFGTGTYTANFALTYLPDNCFSCVRLRDSFHWYRIEPLLLTTHYSLLTACCRCCCCCSLMLLLPANPVAAAPCRCCESVQRTRRNLQRRRFVQLEKECRELCH